MSYAEQIPNVEEIEFLKAEGFNVEETIPPSAGLALKADLAKYTMEQNMSLSKVYGVPQ